MLVQIRGQRCRALRNITGHQGLVRMHTTGTIECETNNLGCILIMVQWDGRFRMYVFRDEIELIDRANEDERQVA